MQSERNFIDPAVLAGISDLMLLARTVVDGFRAGLHRSMNFGASVEFAQYRPYVQGDDPRFVDWDLYARTDRLHTKQFHDETNLRCILLLDSSASMVFTSGGVTKFHYGRMLAACLAMLLHQQNDAIGLIGFHDSPDLYIPPRNSKPHLRRLLVELNDLAPSGQTDLPKALEYLGSILPLRSLVIIISDLLQPADEMIDYLKLIKAKQHDVSIMQISDPAECSFDFAKSMTFADAENESELFVVPEQFRSEYLENRKRHFEKIRRECLSVEIDLEEFVTTEPLDRALYHFIQQRTQRGKTMRARIHHPAAGGR